MKWFLRCLVLALHVCVITGFERPVPGYPRYHYEGDVSYGEHHLIITGVALQDDGEYQCQVGPTEDEEPIWAAANVTVLVAPTSISIVGWEDGETVGVEAHTSLVLQCLVENARPAPAVTWYKNGVLIDSDEQEDSVEEGSEPRLQNLRSRYLLSVTEEGDGEQISCRGHHPALTEALTALVASVTISVLHAPEPPIISGYKLGTTVMAEEIVNLSCSSEGGVPEPVVEWYREDVLIDDSWTKEESRVVNHLVISVKPQDDGAIFKCHVSNGVNDLPLQDSIRINVLYPPEKVTIEAPSFVTIGDKIELVCHSSPSNPKSQLRLKIEGKEFSVNSTTVEKAPESGWLTSSIIRNYLVNENTPRDGTHVTAECEAITPISTNVVTSMVTIDIVKSPEPPLLDGIPLKVEKGKKISVSCYSRGGNPTPSMQLLKGDQLLESNLRSHENVTEIFSEFRAEESDNGERLRCQLSHPAYQQPLETSQPLNVEFAPRRISVVSSTSSVKLGDTVSLVCETSPSNPLAEVSWWSQGKPVQGAVIIGNKKEDFGQITRSEFSLEATVRDDGRSFVCEASNGLEQPIRGNVTIAVLHAPVWIVVPDDRIVIKEGRNLTIEAQASANPLPLRYEWKKNNILLPLNDAILAYTNVSRHHGGPYEVTALNPTGTANASFVLDVQYPPEASIKPSNITLRQNEEGIIICSAAGNPKPEVKWISQQNNRVMASGFASVIYRIEKAQIEDAKTIICEASNGVGETFRKLAKILIEHGAMILSHSGLSQRFHENHAFILCHARGFPEPLFQWSTDSEIISYESDGAFEVQQTRLVDDVSLWLSIVSVSNMKERKVDMLKCSVSNALGEDFREIDLTTSHFSPSNRILKVTRVMNDSSNVTFDNLLPKTLNLATLYGATRSEFVVEVADSLVISLEDESVISPTNSHKSTLAFGGIKIPRLVLLITTLTGISLLAVNIAVITCYLRARKNHKQDSCMRLFGTGSGDTSEVKSLSSDVYFPTQKENRIYRTISLTSLQSPAEKLTEQYSFHQRRVSLSDMSSTSSVSQRPVGSFRINESPILLKRKIPESKNFELTLNRDSLDMTDKLQLENDSSPSPQIRWNPQPTTMRPMMHSPFSPEVNVNPQSFKESETNQHTRLIPKNINYFANGETHMNNKESHPQISNYSYDKKDAFTQQLFQPRRHSQISFHHTDPYHQHGLQQDHIQEDAESVKPKYHTLNLASLCNMEMSACNSRHCYSQKICPECPCKCPFTKNTQDFTIYNPRQRGSVSLCTSSLPRYFKNAHDPYHNYNPAYYCEECCCESNGIKAAFSSLELCRVKNSRWPKTQYPYRNPYFRSNSLETSYPLLHTTETAMSKIEELNLNIRKTELPTGTLETSIINRRKPFTFNENIPEDPSSGNENHSVELTDLPNHVSNSYQSPKSKPTHPRVTFFLAETSNNSSREHETPSPPQLQNNHDFTINKRNLNGKKCFSDGEEDTTISSSESTSSIVEQKFQSYFRNNSLTRGEKRSKKIKL